MIKLALIGKNISHSKSQEMYEKILNKKIHYKILDYDSAELIPSAETLLNEYSGVSITAPYKSHFIGEIENKTEFSFINLLYKVEGKLFGDLTDYSALKVLLKDKSSRCDITKVVILGDGNMSLLVQSCLNNLKIQFIVLSRKQDNLVSWDKIKVDKNTLIVNTCSRDFVVRAEKQFDCGFWDLNYSMIEHDSILSDHFKSYENGLNLLELQAKHALKFWNL